jgi:anti-anti-sigma factor
MGAAHHEGMERRGERVERSSGAAPSRDPVGGGHDPAAGDLLSVRVESASTDVPVVSLTGELDLSTVPKVERRLLGQLRSHPAIVVDLTSLRFIDSSGIGLLIKAFRSTEDGRGMHTVISEGSQVDRVLRLAGVDRALPVFLNRTDAVAAFAPSRNGGGAP